MTRNLKALALGLVAALAMSALFTSGASSNILAQTGGHFTVDANTPLPVSLHGHGSQGSVHRIHLIWWGNSITCTETYTGSLGASTVTSLTIAVSTTECSENHTARMNGCAYIFTIRDTDASTKHSPMHLSCPAGKKMEWELHGLCVTTFGEQTIPNAVAYTTALVNNKHVLTLDFTTAGFTYEKHGLCEFWNPVGTGPHTGAELVGAMRIAATDALGQPAGITATGRNGH